MDFSVIEESLLYSFASKSEAQRRFLLERTYQDDDIAREDRRLIPVFEGLERAGLLDLVRSADDGRILDVIPTEEGRRHIAGL